ncbi:MULTISPECIES: copper chaperone PCu(A)C [unclassified Corynebacterium]|uniref:copper chaperone PCu(A)C n=1 Tax=unclassified Corynebacterium TaxID=2624378 RepID=UPI0029C9C84F|nr:MULTISPECIES: copper chaperone PCu(A)C [unclassified Corynebacterium]WPF65213.1 copper chaperone PCu(A)C [Corynebacterium sp. 22KM0430]WPF67708.1 copper chaperone PCu(A)C [Corynebacterium sp. 21KM1197]
MKAVKIGAGAAALALGLFAAGCSSSDEQTTGTTESAEATGVTEGTATTTATTAAADSTASVRLDDAVVRAKGEDNDMTSIFGTLTNGTDEDITVESFTTSLGEAQYQLHEVVDGVMREKSGGFDVPAHGSHELKPGGDHMMVMGYEHPVAAGDEITVTLKLSDGSEVELEPIPVRTIGAGDENYGDIDGQGDQGGHEGHDGHGGHEH